MSGNDIISWQQRIQFSDSNYSFVPRIPSGTQSPLAPHHYVITLDRTVVVTGSPIKSFIAPCRLPAGFGQVMTAGMEEVSCPHDISVKRKLCVCVGGGAWRKTPVVTTPVPAHLPQWTDTNQWGPTEQGENKENHQLYNSLWIMKTGSWWLLKTFQSVISYQKLTTIQSVSHSLHKNKVLRLIFSHSALEQSNVLIC